MPAFKSAEGYRNFARHVTLSNRYVHDSEAKDFLDTLIREAAPRGESIPLGSIFWRAQLGHDWMPLLDPEGRQYDETPSPFSPERMKPLRNRAREGRANPKGIPYLYVSTQRDTAMAEVRPWLGSYVSVAQFKILRDRRVVNCTEEARPGHFYFGAVPPEKWDDTVWADIDYAFSRPVTASDDDAEYVPTQIIAELFKTAGFEGLAYRSSLGPGHNLVLFDLDGAVLVNCSLYEVRGVTFNFEECANPYFLAEHGETDTKEG